jgi:hypothetical protein
VEKREFESRLLEVVFQSTHRPVNARSNFAVDSWLYESLLVLKVMGLDSSGAWLDPDLFSVPPDAHKEFKLCRESDETQGASVPERLRSSV